MDPPPELLALQVAEDENRLDEAAIFLQGPAQGRLAAVGLEPADQQRGGDPAPLQRPDGPQQVIPAAQDQVAADPTLEPRLQIRIAPTSVEAIEPLVAQVADARRELQAQEVEQREDDLGEASGVRRVF